MRRLTLTLTLVRASGPKRAGQMKRLLPAAQVGIVKIGEPKLGRFFATETTSEESQAKGLFEDALKLLENEAKKTKAMKKMKQAAEMGLKEAQGAYGQLLLKEAVQDDKFSHMPDSSALQVEQLVPTLDSLGKPTGGRRTADETKLEIIRIRNKNKGRPVVDNRKLGIEWLLSAATQGHTDSMVVLGNAYMQSEKDRQAMELVGLTQEDAMEFYETAANSDPPHPDALFNLGTIYLEQGKGPAALEAMLKAGTVCKDPSALYWLGQLYIEGDPLVTGVEEDIERGWEFIEEASSLGYAPAQIYAAVFLSSDPEMHHVAKKYLDMAIAQDDAEALFLCADLHMQEHGSFYGNSGRDMTKALRLYERAGMQGHGDALCSAGAMHFHGLGTPKDHLEAYRAYEQAAKLGCMTAYRNIASMYMNGDGPLDQNTEIAEEILRAVDSVESKKAR